MRLLDDLEQAVARYLADLRAGAGASLWDAFHFVPTRCS
jgi:hypothetical protein